MILGGVAQAITRARILIKIDEGWTAPQVATALDVSERTGSAPSGGMPRKDWTRC